MGQDFMSVTLHNGLQSELVTLKIILQTNRLSLRKITAEKFETSGKIPINLIRIYRTYLTFIKKNLKDPNMSLVGLGNTGIM